MFYNRDAKSPLDALFNKHAKATGLRYDFLRNIGQIESSYNPRAAAKGSSAKGVMQLIHGTGGMFGLKTDEDFYDPDKNIGAGAQYLAQMLKASHGDEIRAALAYHSGPGSDDVKAYDRGDYSAITPAGRDYINKVKGNAQGGAHAEPHFEEAGQGHVTLNLPTESPKANAKLDALAKADLPLASQAFTNDPDVGAAIPDPKAASDYENVFRDQNAGMSPSQVEDLSTFHGTGEASETGLKTSTFGTAYRAYQSGGVSQAWQAVRPNMLNDPLTDEQIKKMDSSGVDPKYWTTIEGASPDNTDRAIQLAKQNQAMDEQLVKDHVGVGANLVGGTVGMLGDPTTYLALLQPELGGAALAERLGGGALVRFATKSGLKAVEGAGYGVASAYMKQHVSGGDLDLGQAALGGAILAGGLHTTVAGGRTLLPRVTSRFRPEPEVTLDNPQGGASTFDTAEVSQNTLHLDTHEHARRLELSESARTYGLPDPTMREFTGEERVHSHQGQSYVVDGDLTPTDAVESHPLENGAAPTVFTVTGQRMDGSNPMNPATRRAATHIAEDFGEQDFHTVNTRYNLKAAQGMSWGRSLTDIGYSMNRAADDQLREFNGMLMQSPTGMVDKGAAGAEWQMGGGKWYGNRIGKFTGSEILENLRALDNQTETLLRKATKDIEKTARYMGMDKASAMDEMYRRVSLAIEDTTGTKWNQLSPQEQQVGEVLRKHFSDKHFYATNTGHWGMKDAPSIINSRINGSNYIPIVYDRGIVNDFIVAMGSEERAQAAVTASFVRSYHASPEVRARLDEHFQDEHLSQPEVQKRQKIADEQKEKVDKHQENENKAKQQMDSLGSKEDHTNGYVTKALQEKGYGHPVEEDDAFNAKVLAAYEKRMAQFKKAVPQEKQDAIFSEMRQKFIDERNSIIKKAKSDANVEWQNVRRRVNKMENNTREATRKWEELKAQVKAELTPEELEAKVIKEANDTAYGIIKGGEGDNAQDLAAINRMVESGDLIGMGNTGYRKTRSLFGYDAEIPLGANGEMFSVNNLRHFNMNDIIKNYNSQMNGQIAITGSTGMLPEVAQAHLNEIEARLKTPKGVKLHGKELAQAKAHLEDITTTKEGLKLLMGRGRDNDSHKAWRTVSSILTDLAYVTHNMYFWLNNFGETAGLVSKTLHQMAVDAFPAVGRVTGRDISKFSREELTQLHHDLLGHEIHNHIRPSRQETVDKMINSGVNHYVAQGLGTIKTATGNIAEWSPFTKLLQGSTKMILECQEKEAIQSIAKHAMGGGETFYMDKRFLNSAGLTEEQGAQVLQLFRDHSTVDAEGRIHITDIDNFRHDPRSAMLMRVARRAGAEAIQKESISQSSSRAIGGWGNLALQFKRFVMKSMNSKFFRNMHEFNGNSRKVDMGIQTLLASGLATMVYGLQASMQAMGMPEERRKEYLHYKFSPEMMAYQAIGRNTTFGAPVGMLANVAGMAGYEPALAIRSSVLSPEGAPDKNQPSIWNSPDKITSAVGSGIARQFPAVNFAASSLAAGYNGLQMLTAKDQITANHAAQGAYNAMRNITPIDPLHQAILRHAFESNGVKLGK